MCCACTQVFFFSHATPTRKHTRARARTLLNAREHAQACGAPAGTSSSSSMDTLLRAGPPVAALPPPRPARAQQQRPAGVRRPEGPAILDKGSPPCVWGGDSHLAAAARRGPARPGPTRPGDPKSDAAQRVAAPARHCIFFDAGRACSGPAGRVGRPFRTPGPGRNGARSAGRIIAQCLETSS
jgi:hypothetical protein